MHTLIHRLLLAFFGPDPLTEAELQTNINHLDALLKQHRADSTARFDITRERAALQAALDARQRQNILQGQP